MPAKVPQKSFSHRYIALLRAINVGGHAIVKMNDLRNLFERLGFQDVQTYIQSGNVVFSAEESDPTKLARLIEKKLESFLGHHSTVFLFFPEELKEAAAHNTLEPERFEKEQHCQLLFLNEKPNAERHKAVMALQGKEYRFHLHSKVLYYSYSRKLEGRRRTINFEKVLDVTATGRTWKVINKLIELAENQE